jgi:hypothetical protein
MSLACATDRFCAICKGVYHPRSSMQTVCSQRCAKKKVDADKKTERKQTKARREALKTIPDLIKAAQKEFNAYIRARDKDQPCICCGRTASDGDLLTGSRWDAGHYRSTGSASHLRFHEDNCHRQLVRCNRHGAGRAVDYRLGLVSRIGLSRVEALEANNAVRKWTREELIAIRATYKAKLKELEKGQA